jgi:release factor glutamine methyltransferase
VSAPPASGLPGEGCAAPDSSIAAHVMTARRRLRSAGLAPADADLDARLIAQHVLGWTTERFLTDAPGIPPDGFQTAYSRLIGRRGAREPLAYIVGHREFWGLDIEVTPAVLVPRPETELLVESVLEWLGSGTGAVTIGDVCTGSGCIAVALARERPAATIIGLDISSAALAVARANAIRHGVADRIRFVRADLLSGIAGPFDVLVANPPYVPFCDRPALASEVAHHEPALALFGGEDGTAVIRRLVPQARELIRDGGTLMFEFGLGHAEAVAELIAATPGLALVDLRRDLQDIPRVAIARRT